MIDSQVSLNRIHFIGREDRALLRSNSSARTDVDAWRGASFLRVLPTCLNQLCIDSKAINLLVIFSAQQHGFSPTGLPYGYIFRDGIIR